MPKHLNMHLVLLCGCLWVTVCTVAGAQLPTLVAPPAQRAQVAVVEEAEAVPGPAALDEPIAAGEAPVTIEAGNVVDETIILEGPEALEGPLEQQVKAMEVQFIQQYRPLLISELYFLRKVCHPSKDVGEKLTEAGQKAMADAGKQAANVQRNMMRGQFAVFPGNNAYPDARKLIRDALAVAVKEHLSADKAASYDEELQKRVEARKRVMVHYLTARIDADLALSAEQRQQIMDSLTTNWDPAWDQNIEMIMYGENFLPAIPDHFVSQFLTKTQGQIWQNQNRNRGAIIGFGASLPGLAMEAVEVEWDEDTEGN